MRQNHNEYAKNYPAAGFKPTSLPLQCGRFTATLCRPPKLSRRLFHNYQIFYVFIFIIKVIKKSSRRFGDQHFVGKCRINESVSNVICKFVTERYCQCPNLNCRTVGYNYREKKRLVASKYCHTVNCQNIAMYNL